MCITIQWHALHTRIHSCTMEGHVLFPGGVIVGVTVRNVHQATLQHAQLSSDATEVSCISPHRERSSATQAPPYERRRTGCNKTVTEYRYEQLRLYSFDRSPHEERAPSERLVWLTALLNNKQVRGAQVCRLPRWHCRRRRVSCLAGLLRCMQRSRLPLERVSWNANVQLSVVRSVQHSLPDRQNAMHKRSFGERINILSCTVSCVQVVDRPRQPIPVHVVRISLRRWTVHVSPQRRSIRRRHLSVLCFGDRLRPRLFALVVNCLPWPEARKSASGPRGSSQVDRFRLRKEARRQVWNAEVELTSDCSKKKASAAEFRFLL